ncbi:MAG TPA: hypothetical protein ENH06_01205 [bacterium]|nr:hypothetical protein [bacterium]
MIAVKQTITLKDNYKKLRINMGFVRGHLRRLKGGGSTLVRDFSRKNKKRIEKELELRRNLKLIEIEALKEEKKLIKKEKEAKKKSNRKKEELKAIEKGKTQARKGSISKQLFKILTEDSKKPKRKTLKKKVTKRKTLKKKPQKRKTKHKSKKS